MRVVAADEEDLVALQFQVAVEGAGQQLHGGNEDAEGLGEQGDGGKEFDFHDKRWGGCEDMRARQGGGAKVGFNAERFKGHIHFFIGFYITKGL